MTKEELLAQVEGVIGEQQAKLEVLKQKALDASHDSLEDIQAAIGELEPKLAQAKLKAEEIAKIADDAWDDAKEALETGWHESTAKLEEGWNSFTDKVKSFLS